MIVYCISAHVFYEREGKTFIIQRILLVPANDEDAASEMVEEWLNQQFPEPAYYNHEYEVRPLEEVTLSGSEMLELRVSSDPIAILNRKNPP